ncbi:MAG TPA: EAL domain-containing protein [Steroidobacteraceae bacterium]
MPKTFNYPLVALSVLVAVFVSNTALSLFFRVAGLQNPRSSQARMWLGGGAAAMGAGIWATHFLGMLALSLPIQLTYDPATTVASLGIAIVSSFAALRVAAYHHVSLARLFVGSCLLGGGISAMHYSGMAAIQIVPLIKYEPALVLAAGAMAVGGSFLALWLFLSARDLLYWRKTIVRGVAACVLGLSIVGMHYMAIFGSIFVSGAYCTGRGGADNQWLAILIATVAFAIVAIMTILLTYDGYLSAKTREYGEQLEQANAQLHHAVTHDSLTGLPNRLLLARELDELIERSSGGPRCFAVMLIDLDRFKDVNDSLGHLAGDELLRTVSQRMGAKLRAGTVLARIGGDEFVVVLNDLQDHAVSVGVAERLQQAIAQPVTLCGIAVHISASIGIARFPDDGADSSALLRRADAAMYHVKNNGRGGHQFYSSEIRMPSRERLEVDDALRKALVDREFELHYQPKVDVRTGRIEGAEALIRWRHPQRGLISPGDFIPLAEETGLIVPMGEWALREACRQALEWQHSRVGSVRVAVNVSAKQLERRDFVEVVARIVGESGLAPSLLELEVTESAVMRDAQSSIAALRQLTELGIAVSLDDFGTGYSSLSYLRRLPLTKLKIDRSFIQELGIASDSEQIVRAIVSLGHTLHLKVIAEGVESAAQLHFLREIGCDKYQGFYCSKALPAAEFARLASANRAVEAGTFMLGRAIPA